jgi:hypothetical protein
VRVFPAEVCAQQVASFAAASHPQFCSIQAVGEGRSLLFPFAVEEDFHLDVAGIASGLLFCRAEGLVECVAPE